MTEEMFLNFNPLSFSLGMVQICSECNDKYIHSAQAVTEKGADKMAQLGNGGRFSPSDSRSQANSDSSMVRFKVGIEQ